MGWRKRPEAPPPFVAGDTYIVPIMLAHADVRMLPFVPEQPTADDPDQILGEVTLPDGTHAQGVVPLHTLRRDTWPHT